MNEETKISGLTFHEPQPNYTIQYGNKGKVAGTVSFNVSPPTFEGDMDGSARVFFDYAVTVFPHLLKERQDKDLIAKLQALRVYPYCGCYAEENEPNGDYLPYDAVVKLLQEQQRHGAGE